MLEDAHVADWQSDPFSNGAYMYVPVGASDLPKRLAEPIESAVYFAGEATEVKLAGTVGGALASATLAANQILTYA